MARGAQATVLQGSEPGQGRMTGTRGAAAHLVKTPGWRRLPRRDMSHLTGLATSNQEVSTHVKSLRQVVLVFVLFGHDPFFYPFLVLRLTFDRL